MLRFCTIVEVSSAGENLIFFLKKDHKWLNLKICLIKYQVDVSENLKLDMDKIIILLKFSCKFKSENSRLLF